MAIEQRLSLAAPERFDLALAVFGHGWVDLAPFVWDERRNWLETTVELSTSGHVVDLRISSGTRVRIRVQTASRLSSSELCQLRARVRTMLRVDEDLAPFWALCREHPPLSWVAERGAGRLLRAPSLFEDLTKILFTTNCAWSNTRQMTRRLIASLGRPGPSGRHAFPSASRCAAEDEPFFREQIRAGYRAPHCVAIARGFASGQLAATHFEDPELPTADLRKRLLALPGFGPYAAGQAMRLLGRYDDLALDSWCRSRLADLRGRRRAQTDPQIARRYRRFSDYAGLAMWMEVTAHWHDESSKVRA